MAALEIGSVSATPTSTETAMPISSGCSSVAHMMMLPTALATAPMDGAHRALRPTPTRIVTAGVTRMSTLVSLLTSLPTSAAMMAMR